MNGKILLHVHFRAICVLVWLGIVPDLAIDILLGTLPINRYIWCIFPVKRKSFSETPISSYLGFTQKLHISKSNCGVCKRTHSQHKQDQQWIRTNANFNPHDAPKRFKISHWWSWDGHYIRLRYSNCRAQNTGKNLSTDVHRVWRD